MNGSRHPVQPPLRRGLTAVTTAVLGATLAVAACGEGRAGASPDVVRRDSAGVEIVRSEAPAWSEAERWRVETDDPLLDVGSASGAADQELYQVRGLVRLSDGRWVVANGGTNELRFYAPDGELVARAGSQGEGPGEFRRLSGLERLPGDSILAWDGALPRVSVFDSTGNLVRSFRLDDPPADVEGEPELSVSRVFPVGVFREGSLLARGLDLPMGENPSSGLTTPTRAYFLYDRDGGYRNLIATYPGAERWMRVTESTIEIRTLPFTVNPLQVVAGDRWYFGGGDRYEISVRTSDSAPARLIRRRHETRDVSEADEETYITERLNGVDDPDARDELRRSLQEQPFPSTFPAYANLTVSRDGHLWIQSYRRPGESPPPWSVFALDGRWLGDVQLPEDFDPMWIDDEVVAGVWEDELEVEHLRAYRLVKP
jgi:hypothetical protein